MQVNTGNKSKTGQPYFYSPVRDKTVHWHMIKFQVEASVAEYLFEEEATYTVQDFGLHRSSRKFSFDPGDNINQSVTGIEKEAESVVGGDMDVMFHTELAGLYLEKIVLLF